jgi:dihydropteroate synthase
MSAYFRPVPMVDPARPTGALPLTGGWCWFDRVERIERGGPRELVPLTEVPGEVLDRLSGPRAPLLGLTFDRPRLMGIVNVTPDSFSDGGTFFEPSGAIVHAKAMRQAGADILDVGGESTRPGARELPVQDEIVRVLGVVKAAAAMAPVSIDTRKAAVAEAALAAGAGLVNDVSAFSHDPAMPALVAASGAPVCLMHSQGSPETMQDDPRYDEVLLDVYDFLAAAVDGALAAGIERERIVVDPGIGFGKRLEHNLALIRGLGLFHGLGVPVLLGASRKRFIGTITGVEAARQRLAGSLAVAQAAILQGVQIVRVHDMDETRQVAQMTGALIGREWRRE